MKSSLLLHDRIDWQSDDSHALLNPKLPEAERSKLLAALQGLPHLSGHLWMATSGSTGKMKWVALSKKGLLASAEAVNRHLDADSSNSKDIWFRAIPTFHVGGLGILARAHLTGARVVDVEARFKNWNVVLFAQLIEESQSTLVSLVPTQVYDLVAHEIEAPPAVRAAIIGGASLSEKLYERARALGWPVLPSYGFTECCSQIATASLESLRGSEYPELKLLSHVRARTDLSGKIEVSSPALLTGMGIDRGDRFEFVDPKIEGWYAPGDRGEISGDSIRVHGRASAFFKIGGEAIDLNRIYGLFEEACLEIGASFDAAIAVLSDERLGHRLVLAVSPGVLETKLRALEAAYNKRVLPIERVRAIYALKIPRTPLGKLLPGALSREIESGRASLLSESGS